MSKLCNKDSTDGTMWRSDVDGSMFHYHTLDDVGMKFVGYLFLRTRVKIKVQARVQARVQLQMGVNFEISMI